MDLHRLEVFCQVYEERSFSKGARRLGLSQPTVSIHVKALEETLGVQLFNRLGREIEPTRAAHFLYEHGRPLVRDMYLLLEKMGGYLGRLEGELEIGASTVPGEYLLPRVLSSFRQEHPEVRGRILIRDSERIVRAVLDGEVPVGCVGARIDHASLAYRQIATDRLVLAVPPGSRWTRLPEASLEQLQEAPLIVREPGSGTRRRLERLLESQGLTLADFQVAVELGTAAAVKEAVKSGLGVSFVSDLAVASEQQAGLLALVPLAGVPAVERTFYLVRDERRALSPLVQAFVEHLGRVL